MKKQLFYILIVSFLSIAKSSAQELFNLSEPASNIPHKALGIRMFSESYKEVNQWRNVSALRLMYGWLPNLSVYFTAMASNHHGLLLPESFPYHNTPERGAYYPYRFNGVQLYMKYRFLTLDQQNEHFRMAAYLEGGLVNTTHHEAEPNITMGDNSGIAGGFIATYLKHKMAVSLTTGLTIPASYRGVSPDEYPGLPDIPEFVKYGKSLDYRLSLGYLIYPKRYTSFQQTNINLYTEFTGKYYDNTLVRIFDGMDNEYWLENHFYPPALKRAAYLDISPGIQGIFNSNLRVDFSMTFPLIGISYAKMYPLYTIGLQYYLYL